MNTSEVSKKLLSDYKIVILYHIFVQPFSTSEVSKKLLSDYEVVILYHNFRAAFQHIRSFEETSK